MKVVKLYGVGKQIRVKLEEDGQYEDDWLVDRVEIDSSLLRKITWNDEG